MGWFDPNCACALRLHPTGWKVGGTLWFFGPRCLAAQRHAAAWLPLMSHVWVINVSIHIYMGASQGAWFSWLVYTIARCLTVSFKPSLLGFAVWWIFRENVLIDTSNPGDNSFFQLGRERIHIYIYGTNLLNQTDNSLYEGSYELLSIWEVIISIWIGGYTISTFDQTIGAYNYPLVN